MKWLFREEEEDNECGLEDGWEDGEDEEDDKDKEERW